MRSFGKLYIPSKSPRAKPRREFHVETIRQIQSTLFCKRSDISDCSEVACYKCLFCKDNITLFTKWYRGKKLMYRRKLLDNL